ncbi:MAG: hypothetical protein NC203_06790, partial [Firmicutes bacterium]|nr:hypothetical protein [Bacillota bacterium]
MKIDILSKTTLKLTLTAEDMDKNSLCYEILSGEGSSCRRAIGRLLKSDCKPESAAMAAQLLNGQPRLFVEAFRRMDGGCMLYVSALDRKTGKSGELLDGGVSPLIFETECGEDLGLACRCLVLEKKNGAKFRSELFYGRDKYRLAIIPLNTCRSRIIRILGEYGRVCSEELAAACTQEYFER